MKLFAESIQLFPGESFRLLRWRRTLRQVEAVDEAGRGHAFDGAGHAWHHHAQAELTLVSGGSGLRCIGDDIGPFRAPDLVLLGPGLPHHWHETGPTRGYAIQFGVEFDRPFWQLPESSRLRHVWAESVRGIRITGGAVDRIAALLRRADAAGGLARLALLLEILGILADLPARQRRPIASPAFAAAVRPAVYRGVRNAVGLVFENFRQPLSLRDALGAAGMSRATFCRQFRHHTGRTFAAFVAEVRLRDAARRLAESDESVSEIAFGSGYATLSHFHHQFRRLYGLSPRRFREAMRRGRRPDGDVSLRRGSGCGLRGAGARPPATARSS